MHYIAGTKIKVQQRTISTIKPGMTSAQIRANSTKSTKFTKQREQFETDVDYTLTRIYKEHDNILYQFSAMSGERVTAVFENINQAETFISELRNETVPDYTSVYTNMTD
jgi:thiamine pyrophosphokinase